MLLIAVSTPRLTYLRCKIEQYVQGAYGYGKGIVALRTGVQRL